MTMIKAIAKIFQRAKQKIFPSFFSFACSLITGFSLGYFIYANFLQRHFFSWRYLLLSLLIFVFFWLFFGWVNTNFLFKRVNQLPKRKKIVLITFAISLAIIFLFNVQLQPVYYLLPDSEFEIAFDIDADAQVYDGIKLIWINTGQGFVHNANMEIDGDYEVADTVLIFPPGQTVTIKWQGKAGPESEIVFYATQYEQEVAVRWNGQTSILNLLGDEGERLTFTFKTAIPLWLNILSIITSLVIFSYLIVLLVMLVNLWEPKTSAVNKERTYAWLRFMLPMLLVWIFSLLVFWPGVISSDSRELWRQAVTGDFNDWQSAFFTMVLYLLLKINYSLGFVLILQILFFALVVAFGLGRLEKRGVPKLVLWILSLLFALSPLNNMQVITLWKDIPFSVSILWLSILFFEIYDSDGDWIAHKKNIVLLLFVALLISLLRQNGIPVTAASLLILSFAYKRQRKQFLGILAALLVLFVFIKGPIYDFIGLDRGISGQSNLILLHHVAAHVEAGTEMEADEIAYLNNMLPLSDWDYQCCYVLSTTSQKNFKMSEFLANGAYNRKLALNLFLRDPLVDIRHTFCSGDMAWRFGQNQCKTFSSHGFNTWSAGNQDWIVGNDFNLTENSYLPDLVQKYADTLRIFGFLDDYLVVYLRPAFNFYIFLLCLVIAYIRNDDWKIFLIGVPTILQTIILFLINFAPVIRYFYSTNLVSLFFIAIILYKRREIV